MCRIHTPTPCNTGVHLHSPLALAMQPALMCRIHMPRPHSRMSPSSLFTQPAHMRRIHTSTPCNTGVHLHSPLVLAMQPAHMCRTHTCYGPMAACPHHHLSHSRPICAVFTHATAQKPHVLTITLQHGWPICAIFTYAMAPKATSPQLHQYSIIHLAPSRQESSLISEPANAVPRDLFSPVSLFLGIWRGHQASSPGHTRLGWAIYKSISLLLLLPSYMCDLKDLNAVKWNFTI